MLIDPYTWHIVHILEIIREAPDAISIRTERPAGYELHSGQHAIVRATIDESTYTRQYSFANTPDDTSLWFTVTLSPGGMVSTWLINHARLGDKLAISQRFTGPLAIDLSGHQHIGMIAGGSGIAPIMSHIRSLRNSSMNTSTTLLYSTRENEQCFADELANKQPNETIITRLTSSSPRFSEQEIIDPLTGCDLILICGSRPFVTAMRELCTQNLPDATIAAEAFSL